MPKKTEVELIETEAVIAIPKETFELELIIRIYHDGEVKAVTKKYNPSEVREAITLFEKVVSGEYPCYQLTEEGQEGEGEDGYDERND